MAGLWPEWPVTRLVGVLLVIAGFLEIIAVSAAGAGGDLTAIGVGVVLLLAGIVVTAWPSSGGRRRRGERGRG